MPALSAASPPRPAWPTVHQAFAAALPRIDAVLRFQFRHWPRARREEAVAEARAAAWGAWHGLIRRGRDPVAVGVTAIAANVCRGVRKGRKVGNPTAGRGAMDVQNPEVRRRLGLRVVPFEEVAGPPSGSWQDWLAEDHRVGPAEEACFRLDFAAWLGGLPVRKRRVAELLAVGHGTVEVAQLVGVTPAAISQARVALARSWREFQGEVVA